MYGRKDPLPYSVTLRKEKSNTRAIKGNTCRTNSSYTEAEEIDSKSQKKPVTAPIPYIQPLNMDVRAHPALRTRTNPQGVHSISNCLN